MQENCLPNLLFYGPPGTGKTSAIVACAREMYGKQFKSMVLELNASDARGINVVRHTIKNFVQMRNLTQKGIKLVILDESDNMTSAAQFSLRRSKPPHTPLLHLNNSIQQSKKEQITRAFA